MEKLNIEHPTPNSDLRREQASNVQLGRGRMGMGKGFHLR